MTASDRHAPQPVPPGYEAAIPYLTIRGATQAIEFYRRAFGAELVARLDLPDGRVMHAEMRIGRVVFMFSEENEQWGTRSPSTLGGSPACTLFYVEDVDAFVRRAVDAGATLAMPVQNHFYGDRAGHLADPFGHRWFVATRVEDVSAEELAQRARTMLAG